MINGEKAKLLAKIGQLAIPLQEVAMTNLAPYRWYIYRRMDKAEEVFYAFQILEIPIDYEEDEEHDYSHWLELPDPEFAVVIGKEVPPGAIFIIASILKEIYGDDGVAIYLSYAWAAPETMTATYIGWIIDKERTYDNLSNRFVPSELLGLPLTRMTLSELQEHFPNITPNEDGILTERLSGREMELEAEEEEKRRWEESDYNNPNYNYDSDSWMDNPEDYWNID